MGVAHYNPLWGKKEDFPDDLDIAGHYKAAQPGETVKERLYLVCSQALPRPPIVMTNQGFTRNDAAAAAATTAAAAGHCTIAAARAETPLLRHL